MLAGLKKKLSALASDPTSVMALVVVMYVVKAVLKISIGSRIHSPMISGDGFHNLADLLEAFAVIAVILVSRKPSSKHYPFGQKNIEFFTSLAIGLGLLVMSVQFALKSAVGLLHVFPEADHLLRAYLPLPAHEQLVMDAGTFPWALAVTLGSVVLSFLVGRYQIAIGRASGHASLIADGEETVSDGTIESVTAAGVLGEYLLHLAWLEYPLGLLVALLIARTGWHLFIGAVRVLLQHSIGVEHDACIRELAGQVPGVLAVKEVKTFQVGHAAVCMLNVVTKAGALALPHVKYGVELAVENYVLEAGFKECELHVRFERPDPQYKRVAFAVTKKDGVTVIAPSIAEATHFRFCDEEEGTFVRIKEEPVPVDPIFLLVEKRVAQLYLFSSAPLVVPELGVKGIEVVQAVSYLPAVMGISGAGQLPRQV
jgi:cation diffusion facilitator family transporter